MTRIFVNFLKETTSLENRSFLVAVSPHLKKIGPMCGDQLQGVNDSTTGLLAIDNRFVSSSAQHNINVRSHYRTVFSKPQTEFLEEFNNTTAQVFYARAYDSVQAFLNSQFTLFNDLQKVNAGKIEQVNHR